jgi:transposase
MSTATTTTTAALDVQHLPDDVAVLKRMIEELLGALAARQRELSQIQTRLDQLLRRLYGPRSERFDPSQLSLFTQTDAAAANGDGPTGPDESKPAKAKRRHKHGRQQPPKHLPRQRRLHELTAAERCCSCCGLPRVVIGEEVSEQYDCVPQSIFVIENVRLKYACVGCEQRRRQLSEQSEPPPAAVSEPAAAGSGPTAATTAGATATAAAVLFQPGVVPVVTLSTAPLPLEGVPRCLAAPGLLAHVIVSKFGDHLPLYRQEQMFARQGVPLSRSTLCDWLKQSAALVQPLYQLLQGEVKKSRVIGSDDTPVKVQARGVLASHQGRVWVYLGDTDHPYTVYDYSPDRKQERPQDFLKGYSGFLQADAYSGYDQLYAGGKIVEVGCWAHVRRKFFEAQTTDAARASYVLGVIRQLYAVEKKASQQSAAAGLSLADSWQLRQRLRQEESVPLLTSLRQWLEQERVGVLPKSPMGEAIGYALNQWQALERYTTQGYLAIDNNAAEGALRAVAVGRKNYLFFGSDGGGETAAVLYSLVQTCKRLGIEPWRYLRDVLQRLPSCAAEQLPELLPDRWAAAQRRVSEGVVDSG